jgi:hypothetical protein
MPNCSLMFNVTFEGQSDGCDAPHRARGDVVPHMHGRCFGLEYEVTSCVLFDFVRALRRPHRLQFEDH